MPGDYLSLSEIKKSDQIDRLDPHEYARLIAMPATQLDLFRLQVDLADTLRRHAEAIEGLAKAQAGL